MTAMQTGYQSSAKSSQPPSPRHYRAHSTDDSDKGRHMINEPDIGSGEKSPGEQETDEQIRQIPQRTPEPPKENP